MPEKTEQTPTTLLADDKTTPPPGGEKPADDKQTLLTDSEGGDGGKPKGTETPPEPIKLKPPVGVNPDDPGFVEFTKYAESHKLTQAQAEKALELYMKSATDSLAKQRADYAAQRAEWAKQTQNDPEIGGERLGTSLAMARRAMQKFGTTGLSKVLNDSGLGNHPEVIRFMARAAKLMNEDTFVGTIQSRTPQKASEEDMLRKAYPSMFPKE